VPDSLQLTANRIRAACECVLPGRLDVEVSAVEPLARGWETDNTAFTLESGPPGRRRQQDLVIRVYAGDFAAAKADHEFRVLDALYRSGYPVPRPLALGHEGIPVGDQFILMERIRGKVMWHQLELARGADEERLFDQFCRLLADLHRLDWRGLVTDPTINTSDPLGWTRRELARFRHFIGAMMPGSGFEAALDWLDARARELPCPTPAIVHWDFHPGNVLVRPDGNAVVIDWTGGTVTDPRIDLAWTRLLLGAHGQPGWSEKVLAGYERETGKRVEGIEYFDAAMALRRLFDVTVSLGQGAQRLGMRPGAVDQMRATLPALGRVYDSFRRITGLEVPEVEALLA
jgi:aminoglycoside phosphotransferase (APT) family kinase protein